jgi:hypothetical protein
MCKKLVFLAVLGFVLDLIPAGLAQAADPDLVAHWKFDDGSGTTALDSSGNGNDGTFVGTPQWAAGKLGGALDFDGDNSYVDCGNDEIFGITDAFSLTVWINWRTVTVDWQTVIAKGDNTWRLARGGSSQTMDFGFTDGGPRGWMSVATASDVPLNEWHHVAATIDKIEGAKIYLDGVLEGTNPDKDGITTGGTNYAVFIGENSQATGRFWVGLIDDVRVYKRVLLEGEIQAVMAGAGANYPLASGPNPKDGALHEDTWVTLSWRAGDYAVSHDVYLGDDLNAVSDATKDSDVFRGNQGATFYVAGFPGFAYPEGLVPGTTYYWRIDEVNDANVASPWKGEVWSFSIPPKTAYFPNPPDGAGFVGPDDVTLSWTPGFGAKLHTVYFGDDYDTVANATVGIPSGTSTYNPGPLELEKVYYWRVDEFDAIETHKGDVWNFTTPGAVGNPQPAYDATDVAMNATLSWTASDSAASHELYFGTDKDAVRNVGTGSPEYVGSKALGAESHDPGLLEPDTTYYWRVDEVDGQGNTAKGPLWLFTTGTFLLVDGFESYTDDDTAGEAIWQTWIDGFGVADNGAQAGNLLPPYAEQTIVHGGAQSMPLLYINEAGVTNSEAAKTLTAPRDWTEAGVVELSLWYRGRSDNAGEPMYAAVSNAGGAPAVVANDDPAAAQILDWTEWRVLLQTFADQGVNLTNVDKIGIGLGSKSGMASAGGTGTVFIDDIRLYQAAP